MVRDDDYDLAPDPSPPPATPKTRVTAAAATASGAGRTTAASAGGFVRGKNLVVRDGATLPDRCIKCNAPAPDGRVTKRWAYNIDNEGPGAARIIPFVRVFVWIFWMINQARTRQYLTLTYCVCARHRARRITFLAAMIAGILAGVGLIVQAFKSQSTVMGIVGVWVLLMGALCGLGTTSLAIAVPLHNGAEMKGAGKPFLDSMPKQGSKFVR